MKVAIAIGQYDVYCVYAYYNKNKVEEAIILLILDLFMIQGKTMKQEDLLLF